MSRDAAMENKMAVLGFVMLLALLKYPYYFEPSTILGHKVMITDANSILGQAVAMQYAEYGTELMLVTTNESSVRDLSDRYFAAGAKSVYVRAVDLSDAGQRANLIAEAKSIFGDLHQVVLNHHLDNFETKAWGNNTTTPQRRLANLNHMMEMHFNSYVDLASRSVSLLTKNKGGIGVVMSLVGKVPVAGLADYSASAAAMLGFFPALRQEFRQQRIKVSIASISLGHVITEDDGSAALGKGYPFFGGYLAATTPQAAYQVVEAVSMKKTEMTYPYVSQVQYGLYQMFPSLYEEYCQHYFVSN